jgi:hypothetical protein
MLHSLTIRVIHLSGLIDMRHPFFHGLSFRKCLQFGREVLFNVIHFALGRTVAFL